jgi:MFS family permease
VPRSPVRLIRELPAPVRLLVFGTFVNRAGSFIFPYLTILLQREFGLPPEAAGVALFALGAGGCASVATGGVLTDVLGRRRTLVISLVGSGVVALAMAAATSLSVLGPLLVLFGFLSELYRPASSAIISDLLPSSQRPIGYAALRLAVNFGFASGMLLGGLLAETSWRLLFVGDGLTTLAFGALILGAMPETRVEHDTPAGAPNEGPLRDAWFLLVLVASLGYSLLFFADFTVFPLAVTQGGGYPPFVYGALLAVNGITIGLLEMTIVDYARRFRRLRVAALGAVLTAVGFALVGASRHWTILLASVVTWTFGEILSVPQVMAFVSDYAPVRARGTYLGAYGATWSLGIALGPPLFLPLHAQLGDARFWPLLAALALPTIAIHLLLDRRVDRPERLRGVSRPAGADAALGT